MELKPDPVPPMAIGGRERPKNKSLAFHVIAYPARTMKLV